MLVELALMAAGAVAIGIGVSAYRAFKSRHVKVARELARAKRVDVVDFEEGTTAMVVGAVVVAERTLKAPLSGKPCVYYRLLVEGPERVGKEPQTLLETGEGVDFLVQDDTGVARVCVADAVVSLAKERFDHHAAVKAKVDRMLKEGLLTDSSLRKMSFFEGRLDGGEAVAVSGLGRWEVSASHGAGASYRQRPKQLHIVAPLHICDRSFADADGSSS